jgi:methionyl-tRNA formyltransferase
VPQLRLVFAGSPDAAVPSLEALVAGPHEVVAVVTREDSPQGRRGTLTPTPVAETAQRHGIRVIKANKLAGDATDELLALGADLGVIVAYGGLVKEPLLSAPSHGWVNLHFSLLPRWRGAAPVQRALMAGDEVTGVSVFQLVPELDAGDVFGELTQTINSTDTSGVLLESLAHSGAGLLVSVVDAIADGTARAQPQQGEVTLAPKLALSDGAIDWSDDAQTVANRIRGVTPEPGASTTLDGVRIKVLEVAVVVATEQVGEGLAPGEFALVGSTLLVGTGSSALHVVKVHPAAKKAMAASDWWRGRPQGSTTVASCDTAQKPEGAR